MKSITLRDISVRFGDVQALNEVSLAIKAGEVVLLAGPNGAGKSTLIHVLLGLVRAQRGELTVDGKNRRVDNQFKARLAYLPEAVAFADNLTGRQVLRFFARARGVGKARIDEVLDRVGLSHAGGRAVRGYSRGMRQRLGLAVALLPDVDLLVLDEPTGGLDQEGLNVLWELLETWRDTGRMVLMSSHDLTLLERRVDRICLMRTGNVLADASPSGLRQRAALPARVTLDLSGQGGKDLRQALQQRYGADVDDHGASQIGVDVPPDGLLELLDFRSRFPDAVEHIRVEEPGLDLIYERLLETNREVA